jgi:hypothetical protein
MLFSEDHIQKDVTVYVHMYTRTYKYVFFLKMLFQDSGNILRRVYTHLFKYKVLLCANKYQVINIYINEECCTNLLVSPT